MWALLAVCCALGQTFDVASVKPSVAGPLLQDLLTERFQIKQHRDQRNQSIYELTIAKNGLKLLPAETQQIFKDEDERIAVAQKTAMANMQKMLQTHGSGLGRTFHIGSATVAAFAKVLSSNLQYPVIDRTQLAGLYSFRLTWAPENNSDDPGPPIYSAVQEQLGLKLQLRKAEIELLVIDEVLKIPISN